MGKKLEISIAVCIILAICIIIQTAITLVPFSRYNPNTTKTVDAFSQPWEYQNEEGKKIETKLPGKLFLGTDVTEVSLFNTLPNEVLDGDVFKFTSSCQKVDIFIHEALRQSFGSKDVSMNNFPYFSGKHCMIVPLSQEDAGKRVEIKITVIPVYDWEMRLVQGVEIGPQRQFLLNEIYDHALLWISCIMGLFTSMFLLFLWLINVLYRRKWHLPFQFSIASVLWVLFASCDNTFILTALNYKPLYSVYTEIWFYVMDGLVPITAYGLLWVCDSRVIKRKQMKCIFLHIGIYMSFALMQLVGITSVSLIRSLLMLISIVMYGWIFLGMGQGKRMNNPLFITAVFVIMLGYFLDYLKYLIFLPSLKLGIEYPILFFFNIAILIFSALVIFAVVLQGVYTQVNAEGEIRLTKLQIEMYQNKYDQMQERELKMRKIRHDTIHHLRTIATLFSTGDDTQAKQYIDEILKMINNTQSKEYSKNNIMNITLAWFAEKSKNKGIRFTWDCNIPFRETTYDAQLCSVVSNILENAIEGCQRVEADSFIDIKIKMHGASVFIKASNRFDGVLLKNRNVYVSRKAEDGHGYGISSIKEIARRLNGRCKITTQGDIFTIDVVISGVEEKK